MIHTKVFHKVFTVRANPSEEDYQEYCRILAAAIVSPRFQKSLLEDPRAALLEGYQGESFRLSEDGWAWLRSVQPRSLTELASLLVPVAAVLSPSPPPYLTQTPDHFKV